MVLECVPGDLGKNKRIPEDCELESRLGNISSLCLNRKQKNE